MSAVWGAFALPSLTTIALLIDLVARHRLLPAADRRLLLYGMAVMSLIFYPMAIGLVHVDAYRFGYTPWAPFALAAIGCAIPPWRFRAAIVVLLTLVAFDVHLLPSMNLFDYVVDPFGGLFAIGWCIARGLRRAFARVT